MKNEKIIANIERYVASLDDKKREEFYFVLTCVEKARVPVRQMFLNVDNTIVELVEIVQELKQEIKEAAQKEANGTSYVKRCKLINKLLSKCYREDFRKGFYEEINGEKMQCCIIDGFYGFAFHDDLDIPMNNISPVTLSKALPDTANFDVCSFDIAEIKTALKLYKANKTDKFCKIEISGRFYNAEYFINVIDGLGGNITMYHDTKSLTAAVFKSENGLAILMPMRP